MESFDTVPSIYLCSLFHAQTDVHQVLLPLPVAPLASLPNLDILTSPRPLYVHMHLFFFSLVALPTKSCLRCQVAASPSSVVTL